MSMMRHSRFLLFLVTYKLFPCFFARKESIRYFSSSSELGNKEAFTLLEVMIAVSIIAIALVALLGSQARSLSNATEAHFNIVAPMLASGKLAELEAGKNAPVNDEGDFGDDFPGYSWKIQTENATFDNLEALTELEKPLQKVELTVLWSETKFSYLLTYYGRWQE
jgi:general secretion pathway protein I